MKNRDSVLVTGGSGFIGKSLVAELSRNQELQVFSVDLKHDENTFIDKVQYINCDLTDPVAVKKLPNIKRTRYAISAGVFGLRLSLSKLI